MRRLPEGSAVPDRLGINIYKIEYKIYKYKQNCKHPAGRKPLSRRRRRRSLCWSRCRDGGGSCNGGCSSPPGHTLFPPRRLSAPIAPPLVRHQKPSRHYASGERRKKRLGTATPNRDQRGVFCYHPRKARSRVAVLRRSPKEAILRYCMLPQERNAKCKEHFGVSRLTPNL